MGLVPWPPEQCPPRPAFSSQPLISLCLPTLRPFTIPQVLRTRAPGEGQEEEDDEVEEVEEEAPKVCPGQVPDKRDAALKGQLDALCLTFLLLTLLVWG